MSLPARIEAAPARLGSTKLVAIDGPAGSGKSTLAGQLGAPVIRMDDLYDGWDGLFAVDATVMALLEPLALGKPGRYRRYDWSAGAFAEVHEVQPAPVLVLEGVGAGNLAWAAWTSVLVWVECVDPAERLRRGLLRDGAEHAGRWRQWMRDEAVLFRSQQTRGRADEMVLT